MNNSEQIAYWNGDAGRKWADRDAQMATLLAPVAEALLAHTDLAESRSVLDVGCGGGSETLMLADRLKQGASVLGIDVSAPLLAIAREHTADRDTRGVTVDFVEADAATYDFGERRFDLLFSRFGVMFFDQPAKAFAHLLSAMQPHGTLAFACWQALAHNPLTALPLKAALTVLPAPEAPKPRAPGPFAFAEADYVREMLAEAGWDDIRITPQEIELCWKGAGGYADTVRELVNTGPVGRLIAEVDDSTRAAVYAAAAEALEAHYHEDHLSLTGAVWLVRAKNR